MTVKPILFLLFVLAGFAASAQQHFPAQQPDTNFHIYLLMGQSNMAGRGEVTGSYQKRNHQRVWMLNKQGEWVTARNPLHFDKPGIAGVGPGLSFGIKMAKANPDVNIGLVPCAVGGTSIDLWQPGAFDKVTGTHPYDDALIRARTAMKYGVIKGIIWHQGESDSKPASSAKWLEKLITLIGRLRKEAGNDSLAFVAGELGRYKAVYQSINNGLERLTAIVPGTAIVSSRGLRHKGDGTHFKSSSARKLGKRFAKAMLKLQAP